MGRIFRAFAWMRWRVFINSLERTGARDALERFSVATDKLGPIIALVLLVPSALALGTLGLTAGFGLATDAWAPLMGAVRGILFVVIAVTCISPLILPMRDGSTVVRMLLLPIPRQVLYIAQTAGGAGRPVDPVDDTAAPRDGPRPGDRTASRRGRRGAARRSGVRDRADGDRLAGFVGHPPAAARSPPRRHRDVRLHLPDSDDGDRCRNC